MPGEYHYLVRLTYRPRILVYSLTALTLASLPGATGEFRWLAGLAVYSFLYPHVAYRMAGPLLRQSSAVLRLQHLDSFHVGVYCAAVGFSPMPCVAFVTSLLLSNILLAGTRRAVGSLCWTLPGALAAAWLTGFRFVPYHGAVTSLLSGLSVLLYSGLVAHLGFAQLDELRSGQNNMHHANRRLQGMTDRLRRYISPQIYRAMLDEIEPSPVRTQRKQLAVFFSDIEGFTTLTDTMEAEALTCMLNRYLEEMAAIAIRHGGTIDKFIGDGIMIFFGDPYSNGAREDALACVRMALSMRERMKTLRSEWFEEGITSALHVRIGIHTGFCTVGNIGCDARLDYTIIGGTVNLASRLEALAGPDEILISAETHALVRAEVECTRLPGVTIRGLTRSVDLYQVAGERSSLPLAFEREEIGVKVWLDPHGLDFTAAAALLQQTLEEVERWRNGEAP